MIERSPTTAIDSAYNGHPNPLTPHRVRCGFIRAPDMCYELSIGESLFGGGHIYGVSVVKLTEHGWKPAFDLSGCFHARGEATARISELQSEWQGDAT